MACSVNSVTPLARSTWLPEKASIPFEKDILAFRWTESLVSVAELRARDVLTEM